MHIILYRKDPCLLCEEVEGLLAALQHEYPHTYIGKKGHT